MRQGFLAIAGALALILTASRTADAFEEVPVPPPAALKRQQAAGQGDVAGLQVAPPTAGLGTPATPGGAVAEPSNSLELLTFGVLPKMDFGLDVLYGRPGQDLTLQQSQGIDDQNELGVLGKVKRRF